MWRAALRRLATIVGIVVGVTAAISVTLGALAHSNLAHALAIGYYVVGAGALVGTLGFGLRGPLRREIAEGDRPSGQLLFFGGGRKIRRTTAEERSEGRRNSLLFFAFGMFLIVLGAAIDPTHSLF